MMASLLVAIAASMGNFLQGWDNAAVAGAVIYIKREFNLEKEPTMEGLILAMSLIGATIITTISGPASDWLGRRPMMIISSLLYFLSGLIMLLSPNVYILLLARLIDGFGVGLTVTLVPVYISETAPSDIRGFLNTFPQFSGSAAMFLSYCTIFVMSLKMKPNWRLMLGVLSIPSLIYFMLTIFFLPETPRWLVSKGRMLEAKSVLQKLRAREDVAGEIALLVEGLKVGGETSIEDYIIGPAQEPFDEQGAAEKDRITLYGSQEGLSCVARPAGQSALGLVSRHGSREFQSVPLMDPLVTLFASVHEKLPETGSMRSTLFPNFGSMFNPKAEEWDVESIQREDEGYPSDGGDNEYEDSLESPLLSRQATGAGRKDLVTPQASRGSVLSMQPNRNLIGGGWQLAWKWSEKEGENGGKGGGFKRIYLHQDGFPGSLSGAAVDVATEEFIQASALISKPALYSRELMDGNIVGPAMVHPSEKAIKGPKWGDLLEAGIRRALLVGVGIQILQQFAGVNGVLYYTPQILEQAGVQVLLADLGIGSDAASILVSALTTLLMLPSIAVAMRLMDFSGRRRLLLCTIPVLILSLIVLVVANAASMSGALRAALSTVGVVLYFCFFVMGFGPVPNILCSEIFPTPVRGACIAICALAAWAGDVAVTFSLPAMLGSLGLAGVFGIYAAFCAVALVFVFLKVPETRGMPLEVIAELFSVGAKAARD